MKTEVDLNVLAEALHSAFISPNEGDRNCEPANLVDGLFVLARAVYALADALTTQRKEFPCPKS